MTDLFSSGRAADIILVLIAAEILALYLWNRMSARPPYLGRLWPNLISGFFMVLGLRSALLGLAWPLIAAPLLAGFAFHLFDVARQARSS